MHECTNADFDSPALLHLHFRIAFLHFCIHAFCSVKEMASATSATDTTTPPIDTAATLRPSSEFVWRPALSAIGIGFERPGRSRDRPRAARRDDATGTSGTSPPSSGRSLSPPSTVRLPHRL